MNTQTTQEIYCSDEDDTLVTVLPERVLKQLRRDSSRKTKAAVNCARESAHDLEQQVSKSLEAVAESARKIRALDGQ